MTTVEHIQEREYHRFSFELDELEIRPEYIETLMKHDPENPSGPYSEIIRRALDELDSICDIRGAYTEVDSPQFVADHRSMEIGDETFFLEKIVFGQMKKSEKSALFICTAGPVGEWAKTLMREGDTLKSYVVDVIGSGIVELATDRIQTELKRAQEGHGLKITNRFSPGYCSWDVREQQKLFRWFPVDYCGISLSQSSLMHPIKSVSGIIGIGSRVKYDAYMCRVCDEEMCIYRDKRLLCDSEERANSLSPS